MEDIDKNGDGFIDLEEYIGEQCVKFPHLSFHLVVSLSGCDTIKLFYAGQRG